MILEIDEEDFGGHGALLQEGLFASITLFLVFTYLNIFLLEAVWYYRERNPMRMQWGPLCLNLGGQKGQLWDQINSVLSPHQGMSKDI